MVRGICWHSACRHRTSPRHFPMGPSQLSCGFSQLRPWALLCARPGPGHVRDGQNEAATRGPASEVRAGLGASPRYRPAAAAPIPTAGPIEGRVGPGRKADLPEAQVQNTWLPSPLPEPEDGPIQCRPGIALLAPLLVRRGTLHPLPAAWGGPCCTSDVDMLCRLRLAFSSHLIWTPRYSPAKGGAPEACGTNFQVRLAGQASGVPSSSLAAGVFPLPPRTRQCWRFL